MRPRTQRGNAILAVLIVAGVMSLMTVAALEIASHSRRQAGKHARDMSQMACVEAARQHILGRLRVFGLDPTTLVLDYAMTTDDGTLRLKTGHIGGAAVTSVKALPPQMVGGSRARARDLTNVVVPSAVLGGRHYRVVVSCTDPVAGEMELEFTFKYGL